MNLKTISYFHRVFMHTTWFFDPETIAVCNFRWRLKFEKKPFQFRRKIWNQVLHSYLITTVNENYELKAFFICRHGTKFEWALCASNNQVRLERLYYSYANLEMYIKYDGFAALWLQSNHKKLLKSKITIRWRVETLFENVF